MHWDFALCLTLLTTCDIYMFKYTAENSEESKGSV